MTRVQFRNILVALDLSKREAEEPVREKMLELLDSTRDCFLRTAFPAHFTGSALVVSGDGQKALLHHHRKLDRWLQFGGHCDGDEDVLRVAGREAQEESGIEGLISTSTRRFDLDIHEIPAHGNEPAHDHYDLRLPLDAGLKRLVSKWQALLERRRSHA
jgi:8-oxo-dGTP pyrophosphatase MutT (NUDIX family)